MKFTDTIAAAVLGLATFANGHMQMMSPPPLRSKFNTNTASGDIDYGMASPLSASGSDYPCKGYLKDLGTPGGKSVVTWAPGGSYGFSITGTTANHGGGSCQASLSYDKGQTWKVIHSYIGGCPPQQDSNWNFTVPSDAPAGDAVFAWTWFNKIGNREMYMNCASVTIGAGKKRAATTPFSSLPDLFVANVGNGVCTYEGKDVQFPSPGPIVDNKSEGTAPPGQGACAGTPPDSPPAAPPAGNPGSPPSQAPATSPQATQPAAPSAPVPSMPGGVFITSPIAPQPTTLVSVPSASKPPAAIPSQPQQSPSPAPIAATSAAAPVAATSVAAPIAATSAVPPPPAAPQPTKGGSSPSGGSTTVGSACSQDGYWSCSSDGKSFQRCAAGAWSAVMPVAAGTSCQPGESESLTVLKKRNGSGLRGRRFVSE